MTAWRNPGRPIILASQSARRSEILRGLGFSFDVCAPEAVDETSFFGEGDLESSLRNLATAKAYAVAVRRAEALVLGADTVVVKGGRVMGKPRNRDDARDMLSLLSGEEHRVITGVALLCTGCGFSRAVTVTTEVVFRNLSDDEIDEYLDGDEYCDKAGAYAIQGAAMAFVQGIRGCYYNVVGLPVAETIRNFTEYIRLRE
jgi:septum formation protein